MACTPFFAINKHFGRTLFHRDWSHMCCFIASTFWGVQKAEQWKMVGYVLCSKWQSEIVTTVDKFWRLSVSGLVSQVCLWLSYRWPRSRIMLHVAVWALHFLYVSQEENSSQLPSLELARLKGMVKAIYSVLGRQWMIFCAQKYNKHM